ncbi:Gfo/Idh/MocA family oxidoreductase [Jiangella ureilytica]|uniref:Gfo/Idh/MocA family oxidoreductase n=1 Tax=Jiangella ureilytica TaxID=2530374 RepID=A0A4R4RW93_9ACTN|nr:Gfo/Idh/MocA family oxidoreductase [Jiangella ureilytica]TDC53994.1 Gfo/Idh/MocA family oxidoreductase [Jiangella ureilytica]
MGQQVVGVGIVGAGAISGQYLDTLRRLSTVRVVAVADLDQARAQAAVAGLDGVRAVSVDALLADPEVDVVLNLTPPAGHAPVALAAIAAGKAVYNEKPLAATVADGRRLLTAAAAAGVRVGGAPDTVLGTGVQTARHAVDTGLIGTPAAATATFLCPGHERWHPDPDFYYATGGGPLLDMGPYYVTALVTLLGPVVSVLGAGSTARPTRTIGSGPRTGEEITVEVLTHVTGVLTHASGALSTVTMSFDAVATRAEPIEVHGSAGSLIVPDPNHFDGEVLLRRLGGAGWEPLPVAAGYRISGRGLGVAELMTAPSADAARANGTLALHVLDIMESVLRSAADSTGAVAVETPAQRPAAVPPADEPGREPSSLLG